MYDISEANPLLGTTLGAPFQWADPFLSASEIQQEASSAFIGRLRGTGGGSSAFVPTTSIWSTQDDLIMPNSATSASAMIFPYNLQPVANFAVQSVCSVFGTTAPPSGHLPFFTSAVYTHVGLLVHPLTYALLKDAVTHGGIADLTRIVNLQSLCTQNDYYDPAYQNNNAAACAPSSVEALASCLGAASLYPSASAEPTLRPYAV
jgi:hypothetical protein